MFADALLPNLLVFLLGQFAAIGYLRTGLTRRGLAILLATWVFADVALVARFAYGDSGDVYVAALIGMQVASLLGAGTFVRGRVRRRRPRIVAWRRQRFRAAFVHYLRDELDAARDGYERILRLDPWDAAARLGLATVLARAGHTRRARRMLRAVVSLDAGGEYEHAIATEKRNLARASRRGVALRGRVADSQRTSNVR